MSRASAVNLTLRVIMETGVVAGLAYWGIRTGDTAAAKAALGLTAPLIGFGIWGALDFRQAGPHAESLRLAKNWCSPASQPQRSTRPDSMCSVQPSRPCRSPTTSSCTRSVNGCSSPGQT